MSYEAEIVKDRYEPIYLVQYDITNLLTFNTTWLAFVYVTSFLNEYSWIPPELLSGTEVDEITAVGSVRVGSSYLKQVFSIADCQTNRESFYWDVTEKKLYLHCPNGSNPYLFEVQIGIIYGWRKGGDENSSYYNDIYYDDVVLSIPEITRAKADYFEGRNINEGGTIVIGNASGEYDRIAEDNTFIGNSLRVYGGFAGFTFSQFKLLVTGYAKSVSIGINELSIEIKDKKERLNVPIPSNTFELSDYPNLNENNIGKVIPLIYGTVKNFPVVCVNEDEFDYDADNRPAPAETMYFKVADMTDYDSLSAINAIYVDDGNGHKTDITANCVIDLTDGSFTTDSDYYVPGQTVTIDIDGYEDSAGDLIENALDIIRELIVNYTNAKYNNIYFNTSRWDRAQAFDIGYAINESTMLGDAIEDITQGGTLANFQVDNDDRYSCRIFNQGAGVDLELNEWDVLEPITIYYEQEKLVARLTINYNKDWEKKEYSKYINTEYQDYNNTNYQTYTPKEIETYLSDSTNAQLFSEAFMQIYGVQYKYYRVVTNLISSQLEVTDIIQLPLARPYAPELGISKGEVIESRKNFDDSIIKSTVRVYSIVPPQIWSEGNDWYSDDWYSDDWAVGMYVPDQTA